MVDIRIIRSSSTIQFLQDHTAGQRQEMHWETTMMISVVDWGANQQTKEPQAAEGELAHQMMMISREELSNQHRQITTIILHPIMKEKTLLAVVGVQAVQGVMVTFLIIACMAITT